MNIGKVISGITAGVGTVALLPVAGPIGTVTGLGALLGGTIGGIAGATIATQEEQKRPTTTSSQSAPDTTAADEKVSDLWIRACDLLKQLDDPHIENWLNQITCRSDGPNKLKLVVKNAFTQAWVKTNYLEQITNALNAANDFQTVHLTFEVEGENSAV